MADYKANALMLASKDGHADRVELLLLTHEPVEQVKAAVDFSGVTALMLASMNGHTSCVELLLAHAPEAQVKATAKYGLTALMLASENGHASCVELLLAHVPEEQVKVASDQGSTALMFASHNSRLRCMELLLAHAPEAQVKATNNVNCTALMFASNNGQTGCVELLLAHAPQEQVNATNNDGFTALMHAAVGVAQCHEEAVGNGIVQCPLGAVSDRTECIRILLAYDSPLPTNAGILAKIWPVVTDSARHVRVPTLFNQAIAHCVHQVVQQRHA